MLDKKYCLIHFDKNRNELKQDYFETYSSVVWCIAPTGYGCQLQKRAVGGYWFPIEERYI